MIIESVEYDESEGKIYINGEKELPFTPSILIHPAAAKLIGVPSRLPAPFSSLVRVERKVRKVTPYVLLLPPERQFLLMRNISYHQAPGKLLPAISSEEEALEYLLAEKEPRDVGRIFLENVFFRAGIAVSFERKETFDLPPETLRVIVDWNIDPTTLGRKGVLLPSSKVRVKTVPRLLQSFNPFLRGRRVKGFGRDVFLIKEGDEVTLADAEAAGLDYVISRRVEVSSILGPLPISLLSLLSLASRLLSYRPVGRNIEQIAKASREDHVLLLRAIARIFSSLPRTLASTDVLTPGGREAYITLSNLLLRSPKVYMRLLTNNSACSQSSSGQGLSLQGRFSSLTALLHS